jgi:WD40 repeat protein/type 1 glutamine amidotransferase
MRTIALLIGVLSIARPVFAQRIIEPTFPPPDEIRKPDRTPAKIETAAVPVIAYTPDGRALATAGADKVIRLWDARTGEQSTGQLLATFRGHTAPITAIALRPDGKTLVSISEDQTLRTWEVASVKQRDTLPLKGNPRTTLLRPGAEPILAQIADKTLTLLNYDTSEILHTLGPQENAVRAAAFSPDGKAIVTATEKGAIRVWDVESGILQRAVDAGAPVVALAASNTDVGIACTDGTAKLWPMDGEENPRDLSIKGASVRAVAFSPKGDQFAAGAGKSIKVWDVVTGQRLCTQQGHTADVLSIAFNSNGQKMASAGADGNVNYWTVPLPPIPTDVLDKIKANLPAKATATPKKPRKLLVFWRADAILHKAGVPAANHAIQLMAEKTKAYQADFSRDYDVFDPKILANYDAIVMNSTAHLVMPDAARQPLLDFVNNGGGIVGIHAAIDTFKPWPQGAAIIGATFGGHPWTPSGTWAVKLEEPNHPLLRAFNGNNFKIHDELYEMSDPYTRADRRVLLTADTSDPATAGVKPLHRTDNDFALSWIKTHGKGRVFYCVFGHTADPFENPAVLQYYLDGIQYALGDLDADATPPKR